MYPELEAIFNRMSSNIRVGIKIKKESGDYIHRDNLSDRDGRKNVFMAVDILNSGLSFPEFIKQKLQDYGNIEVIPCKMSGSGVLPITDLSPVKVSRKPPEEKINHDTTTIQPQQPQYPAFAGYNNPGMNAVNQNNSGMNAAQIGEMISEAKIGNHWKNLYDKALNDKERLENKIEKIQDQSYNENKELRKTFESKKELLQDELKSVKAKLETAEERLKLAVEMAKIEQKSWAESPAFEKLAGSIGPLATAAISKGGAAASPGMGNPNMSKARQEFIANVAKSNISDEDLDLLKMVGDTMNNEEFVNELGELLAKY